MNQLMAQKQRKEGKTKVPRKGFVKSSFLLFFPSWLSAFSVFNLENF